MIMKNSEIRLLNNDELSAKLRDTQQELMNLRFQVVTGQLTDTSRLRITRRLIGRMETILRERELSGHEEGEK
jgi:large subunit ribosomal protein L29